LDEPFLRVLEIKNSLLVPLDFVGLELELLKKLFGFIHYIVPLRIV